MSICSTYPGWGNIKSKIGNTAMRNSNWNHLGEKPSRFIKIRIGKGPSLLWGSKTIHTHISG
jgi:hypothetical protein